jgi:hypothetical protein
MIRRRIVVALGIIAGLTGSGLPVAAELVGSISGVVVDQTTQQPLIGVNLVLLDHALGTVSGEDGRFVVLRVPVGTYRLKTTMIGYEESIKPDVVVRSSRITGVRVELAEKVLGLAETVVRADFFSAGEKETVSAVSFNYEEIRRSPGSAQDISRLVQALPSVNLNNDQRNDLVVRGGSPMENLVLVDHLEIPNINHFPTQGGSGGPIGLLNVDLISEADFSAGGYAAAYGDRLSSVLSVSLREGNREEFDGEFTLGMAGAGMIAEGPLPTRRGSWLLTARRAYLDLIVDAIGTGAVPKYSDVQAKVSWDLGPAHQVSLLNINGFDRIDVEPDDQDETDDRTRVDDAQHVAGLTWKWLWGNRGYARSSLACTWGDYGVEVEEGTGPRLLFTKDSQERELVLRSDYYHHLRPGSTLTWGVVAKRLFLDFAVFAAADTNRLAVLVPELRVGEDLTTGKLGAYASYEQALFQRLRVTAGLRWDYFAYNHTSDWSPRLAATCELDEQTSLNAAWGLYCQNLPISLLVQDPDNRTLPNPRAIHYVLGVKRRLSPNTLLSLEGYAKEYDRLPYDPDDPTVSIVDAYANFGSPIAGLLVGGGKAHSQGVELLLQKKLARALYGTCGYSYSVAEYQDLAGVERRRDFDNGQLFSLILGYRPSARFEFSGRWSYAGGRPYTAYDEPLSVLLNKGVIRRDQVNAKRYPPYHRLDLQLDYRKHYERFNLVSFFALLNAYNRANIATYYWDKSDHQRGRIDQWSRIPVGGFELEF